MCRRFIKETGGGGGGGGGGAGGVLRRFKLPSINRVKLQKFQKFQFLKGFVGTD